MDAVASHDMPESWHVFAAREIAAAPYYVAGRGFNPDCGRQFNPCREWQIYCSAACRNAAVTEARRWGHKVAEPLLVWRLYKYSKDPAEAALARAARRYVTQVQSAWRTDRQRRAARAQAGRE